MLWGQGPYPQPELYRCWLATGLLHQRGSAVSIFESHGLRDFIAAGFIVIGYGKGIATGYEKFSADGIVKNFSVKDIAMGCVSLSLRVSLNAPLPRA